MKTRKIVLLCGIAILAIVLVFQLVLDGKNSIKDITFEETPDTIEITTPSGNVNLVYEGEKWVVGENKYPTDSAMASKIVEALKSIRVLQTVSRSAQDDRYGLGEAEVITVKATKDGKVLRTLSVGKTAVTSSQTYIQLDEGKDVLLVSNDLHDTFDVTVDKLRDKQILSIDDTSTLTKLEAVNRDGSFTLVKQGEPALWTLSSSANVVLDANMSLNAEKAASWASSFASLRASAFADNVNVGNAVGTLMLTTADKSVKLTVYEIVTEKPASSDDENAEPTVESTWYCRSSELPYLYQISEYSASNILKKLSDLSSSTEQ